MNISSTHKHITYKRFVFSLFSTLPHINKNLIKIVTVFKIILSIKLMNQMHKIRFKKIK